MGRLTRVAPFLARRIKPDKEEAGAPTGTSLQDVLRANASSNGYELHAMVVLRYLRHAATRTGHPITGQVLELGGYPHAGMALALLLTGVDKLFLNNITPVENAIAREYAENLYALLELSLSNRVALDEVVEPITGTSSVRIRPDRIVILSDLDAAQIDYPDDSFDFIFSITVLEHIVDPAPTIRNCYRLLRPGGWTYHNIDLRDHADFDRPIRFLDYSQQDFEARQAGNNRLRSSDHRRIFESCGFSVDHESFVTALPTLSDGGTDCFHQLSRRLESFMVDDREQVEVWVTDEMRRAMDPRFHGYDLADLSITGLCISAHKPAGRGAGRAKQEGPRA